MPKTRSKNRKKNKKTRKKGKSTDRSVARIFILYVGGTIGMRHSKKKGLVPVRGNLDKLINDMNIEEKLNIKYTIDRADHLIDSSNLRSDDLKHIIKRLLDNYTKYDSFIIIHGTDTLAYTASALSFFLRGWNKPVVVTGSQIPMFEFREDATKNIIDSLIVSLLDIKEVLIVFGGVILRGNRTSKYSSTNFTAYRSPNYGPIGNIGVYLNIYKNKLLQKPHSPKLVRDLSALPDTPIEWSRLARRWNSTGIKIYTQTLLPEENALPFRALVKLSPNAIILRSYGIGNAPVADKQFMKEIQKAIKNGIIVVNTTQCVNGGIDMSYYNTGILLKKMGVLSSYDMTPETIYMKLFYLFQMIGTKNIQLIKKFFGMDIAGELTIDLWGGHISEYLKSYFKQYQEL